MKELNKRKLLLLFVPVLVLIIACMMQAIAISSSASESGETFTATYYYDMQRPIAPGGSFTFKADVNVPATKEAKGWIVGNYVNFDNKEFGIELNKKGFRLFACEGGDSHSSLYFDLSNYLGERHELMVSLDVNTGTAYFYVDGALVNTQTNSVWAGKSDLFNQISPLRIGGDLRKGNGSYLKEELYGVAMYKGLATADSEGKYGTTGLSAMFEYDLTNITIPGYLDDLSESDNNAINPGVYVDPSRTEGLLIGRENDDTSNYPTATYDILQRLDKVPETVEAWVYVPTSVYSSRIGVILGNYSGYQKDSHINFELAANGIPRIQWWGELNDDTTKVGQYDIRFSSSVVPADTWTHLVFVYDNDSGVLSCYLNGELSETKYFYPSIPDSAIDCEYVLGGDNRNLNAQYFKGELGDISVYSDVRTAAEIKADYECGIAMTKDELDKDNCMLYFDLDENDTGKNITDDSGNGYDAFCSGTWLTEAEMEKIRESYGFDISYSFAVIGDTQYTTRKYPEHLPTIYKWIVNNKDNKNIKYAIGLGDITDANGKGTNANYDKYVFVEDSTDELGGGYWMIDTSATGTEWDVAYHAITILDGNLEYSIIRGNHDLLSGGNGFNEYFAGHTAYTNQFVENGGIYGYDGTGEITDVANTWRTLQIGGVKYLMMNLDYGANDSILAWAAEIVDRPEYADYNVIVTTHGYLYSNGTTLDVGDYACPTGQNASNNNGDDIWREFVSKHANIQMILCGHIYYNNITYNQLKADGGNTVTEMIIDPQGIDNTLKGLGVVAMFYFSEDGTKLAVEYYSTVRDAYYKTINQLTFDLEAEGRVLEEDNGWLGTATAPTGSGSESDPYLINNAGHLLWMSNQIKSGSTATFVGKYFEQTSDIDLNGLAIKSIGYMFTSESKMAAFGGNYDGNGYSIKNGSIETYDKTHAYTCDYGHGLFGVIFGAKIENVVLDNVEIIGAGITGAIVGRAAAPLVTDCMYEGFNVISGCEVKSNVKIISMRSAGTYTDPGFDNNYRAGRVGSVCGMAHSTIINGCKSDASFTFSGDVGFAGGIVGTAGVNTTVSNCVYTGTMTLYDNTATQTSAYGGIVGAISPSTQWKATYTGYVHIYDCYNTGNLEFGSIIKNAGELTKNTHWGGILGCGSWLSYVDPTEERPYSYLIERCYNLNEGPELIGARKKQVIGGIAGKNLTTSAAATLYIRDCYSVAVTNFGGDSGTGCCNEYQYQGTTLSREGYLAVHSLGNVSTKDLSVLSAYTAAIDANIENIKANGTESDWIFGNGFPNASASTVGKKYYDVTARVYYVSDGNVWVPQFNTEDAVITAYGIIPSDYADTNAYPVVLFSNGSFVGAYADFGNATAAAVSYDAHGSFTILLRANAIQNVSSSLQNFWGNITVDLNGNTLTKGSSGYVFDIYEYNNSDITTSTDYKGTFKIINGSIIKTGGNAIICINYGEKLVKPCVVDMIFENVTFINKSGNRAIFATWENGYSATDKNATFTANCTFTDCVFDFENSTEDFTMLALTYESHDKTIFNVTLKGGKIVSSRALSITDLVTMDSSANGRPDSFVFEKNADGNYTTLILPEGAPAFTEIFNGGKLVFVKVGTKDGKATYGLLDKKLATIEFVPKTSITLSRDLVLNVYVPKISALCEISFIGNALDLSTLEVKALGNKEYYVIRTPLAASEALNSLTMSVTLSSGESSAKKSYTFNIIKYAKHVLAKGNETTETLLVKDVLSYVRAAYEYFGAEDAEAITEINSILGADYDANNPHVSEGNTENNTTGLASATLVLDSPPSIRFYLNEGSNAAAYEFYSSGNDVKTVTGSDATGSYIEIDVYAYAMCDTVTYTIDGEAGGSYHVESYYKFATDKGDANLVALVDRLIKYCQTARAYRNEILSGVCYHTYESSIKKEATATDKGIRLYECTQCGDSYEENIPTRLKVLAIGNSFSQDAVQHLYIICKEAGIEDLVIGNMYVAGCNLNKHFSNMNGNVDAYTFYLSNAEKNGMVADSTPRSAKYGIEYTDWDYIILQQVSQSAGVPSTFENLQGVINYVKAHKNANAEILWHMTWAYQSDSTHAGFANFNNDQMTMYNAIVSTLQDTILPNSDIGGFIPVGTAIQNLRTSTLGDSLTRDGYHLSNGIGRYAAALTWFAALTGIDVDSVSATPDAYAEVATYLEAIKDAVKNAIEAPFRVTPSAYAPVTD